MNLGANILFFAHQKGLTISSLARKSGVKQPTLHGWTTGRAVKNIDDLKKVCIVLEVSLHMLLYGVKDPHEEPNNTVFKENLGDIRITIERIKIS